eukprot:3775761-Pyramimonas_sp.AAC.1
MGGAVVDSHGGCRVIAATARAEDRRGEGSTCPLPSKEPTELHVGVAEEATARLHRPNKPGRLFRSNPVPRREARGKMIQQKALTRCVMHRALTRSGSSPPEWHTMVARSRKSI